MTNRFFITGTDTNIGKTTATLQLIKKSQNEGFRTLALKPVASGCDLIDNKLYNSDALALQKASMLNPQYEHVNPIRFLEPVSPHIVNTQNISANTIAKLCQDSIDHYNPDHCYIEGAGGWLCPLNESETFADLAQALNAPIIIVIGIKLGCLNHALLTVKAVEATGLMIHGWIANYLSPIETFNSHINTHYNLDYLRAKIQHPLLSIFPFTMG